ncbi:MAG TPA: serine hydrolase [Bacteroidia bacterium]|jgi:CubicO group peptidase (beta-lactamase class C family)|nr:serine hydrolase [Bacteroidia bacterium]
MKRFLLYYFLLNVFNSSLSAQKTNVLRSIILEAYDSIPSLGSILVWQNNNLVCEEYFNGANSETNFNVKSVTKSVVSALAGIAKDKGLLPDLNTPVLKILPQYDVDTVSYKKKMMLRDLLTMQNGIVWYDNNPPKTKPNLNDGIIQYLEQPFDCTPGTKFRYTTPGSHFFAVALAQCIKTDLKTFGDTVLFNYLGINISDWPMDKLGRRNGGSELKLKSNDMIKFGLLYLNEGKVNEKQVISKSWIKESTSEQAILNEWDVLPGANGYGYFWWRRKINGHQAFVATGYGGQLICVIPDLKTVIVTTCFVNDKNRGRSEIKRLHGFIDKIVKVSN